MWIGKKEELKELILYLSVYFGSIAIAALVFSLLALGLDRMFK